jgi:uncharacterized membrane protein HdeD (DUF308 family)
MKTTLDFFARNWWVLLLRGIAAIVFGLAAFVWPGLTLAVLVIMFGAYIFVDGVFGTIDAIRYRKDMDNWWFWLLDGILGILAGAVMLLMPGVSAFVLLVFVAAWAILGGAIRIFAAIQLRKQISGEWILIASGLLSIAFGVAIVALPHAGLVSIAWIIGFWALAFGVLFVLLAFRLRNAAG